MTFDDWWGAYPTQEDYEANCRDAYQAGASSRDAEISELKKDAVRYRLVREYMVSERTDLDDEFVSACSTNEPEKLDAFVDEVLAP